MHNMTFDIWILLIHEVNPQSRPVVITIFARVVCPSVPTFKNLAKQNKFQVRIVIATGETVGLASWIINGTHVLFFFVSVWTIF